MQGIRLVASPPVPNEQPLPMGHDIASYQPPWKTMLEFGANHDLDRMDPNHPQLQHLMHQVRAPLPAK